jgi:hypothetical protein
MLFMAYSPQQSCINGAATRGSIKRKAVGYHAADLCPATAGSRAGSVDSALIGSTARLVDAIARESGVLVDRHKSTKRWFRWHRSRCSAARWTNSESASGRRGRRGADVRFRRRADGGRRSLRQTRAKEGELSDFDWRRFSHLSQPRVREAGARYHKVDLSHFLGWQGRNVFCPAFKRLAHLRRIPSAVIYAGNASPVAADVV